MIKGPTVPVFFLGGVLVSYGWFLPGWPPWSSLAVLIPVFLLLHFSFEVVFAKLAAAVGGFLLCGFALHSALDDRFTQTEVTELVSIQGRVVGMPESFDDYTRFRFRTHADQLESSPQSLPTFWLVKWYRNPPDLQAGQEWELELQAKPPWGLVNFQGQDRERWLFAEGIGGLASVRQGRLLGVHSAHGWLDRVRQQLSHEIARVPDVGPGAGMVRALAVADRSGLSRQERETLAITGTSHLLAISGLHVGLAYALAYWLARLFLFPLGRFLSNGSAIYMLAGWLAAFAYAGLAGFSTSTVRALVMLSVALMALLSQRRLPAMQSLVLALSLVILLDPLAPLKAGAWMSFVAVFALLLWFVPRRGQAINRLSQVVQAQFAVTTLSFPMTAWWFQLSSPAGFLANLLAIPWVSLVVVPLVLLGLIFWPIQAGIAGPLLKLAAISADGLLTVLQPLAAWLLPYSRMLQPGWPTLIVALTAAGLFLLPRGLRIQAPAAVCSSLCFFQLSRHQRIP